MQPQKESADFGLRTPVHCPQCIDVACPEGRTLGGDQHCAQCADSYCQAPLNGKFTVPGITRATQYFE